LPALDVFPAWQERSLRSSGLFRFQHRITNTDAARVSPPEEVAEELAAELSAADVDIVFLDLERCADPGFALDALDAVPGFERGTDGAPLVWWYRTRGLFRLQSP
jgi:hypothetical protein